MDIEFTENQHPSLGLGYSEPNFELRFIPDDTFQNLVFKTFERMKRYSIRNVEVLELFSFTSSVSRSEAKIIQRPADVLCFKVIDYQMTPQGRLLISTEFSDETKRYFENIKSFCPSFIVPPSTIEIANSIEDYVEREMLTTAFRCIFNEYLTMPNGETKLFDIDEIMVDNNLHPL